MPLSWVLSLITWVLFPVAAVWGIRRIGRALRELETGLRHVLYGSESRDLYSRPGSAGDCE